MDIKYFSFEVSEEQAINTEADDMERGVSPERCFRVVRETMEELGYRTAVWYVNGKATMHYAMTLKGIQVRKINDHSA